MTIGYNSAYIQTECRTLITY